MTNLSVPSRSDYVVSLNIGTHIQGTITFRARSLNIMPVESNIMEQILESTKFEGNISQFPSAS